MKVFLPLPEILPDPQTVGNIRFCELKPSIWERLEYLFQLAEETGVYISLALAEWGVHSLKWFWDGGGFFGSQEKSAWTAMQCWRISGKNWHGFARTEMPCSLIIFQWSLPAVLTTGAG